PHDQPWVMSLPLIILAAVSCVAGFIPFGNLVSWNGEPYDFMAHFDWGVASISLAVAVASIALATVMYRKENDLPAKFKNALPALWDWCYHRFYWDELYMFITHKIIFNGVCRPLAWFDRHIIDGTMDSFAILTNKASSAIKPLQSGQVQMYAWIYIIGALLLGGITILCLI
ncbi:MAG: NADH-quinone oxidoreductase subunit L, partial [Muribaculaceae bacterium]|nr:NADH-quinone oxidoreductase subunit L [Muribaculaceae bacterium]